MPAPLTEIRRILAEPGGDMDMTGLPGAAKLLRVGPLLLRHLNESGRRGLFAGLIIREMESLHYMHGFRAVVEVWQKITDRLTPLIPHDAYLGSVISGFVIHSWADDIENIAAELADRIRSALAKPIVLDSGAAVRVRSHFGYLIYPDDSGRVEDHSVITKYVATVSRADRTDRFTHELRDQIRRRERIKERLPEALERQQLGFVYQPQVRLRDGVIVGAEVLIRWQDPLLGTVSPEEFIPIAEKTGDIVAITKQSIANAVVAVEHLPDDRPFRLAVNVSKSLFNDAHFDLFRFTRSLLRRRQCDPGRLHFEITETAYFDPPVAHRAHAIVRQLSQLGIGVVVDDFGTGYGSLPLLSSGTIQCIKLDAGLTRSLTMDGDENRFLNALCVVLDALEIDMIAEGVENHAQVDVLMRKGIQIVQGFHFAPPLTCDAMLQLLSEGSTLINPAPK